ncbi:glycine--tRNA ligase subunit beta [Paenibacillus yanchengensis]|uniref:Glycine--tRNA ligase beta subunit n=1 Tax=Paenibacillus yanchengensis TaxID=2035833 RepID=A0ABW4YKU4_9BACL
MTKDLLLEIGLEEVPARFVRGAIEQLQDKVEKWLQDNRIGYSKAKAYATPRRLAVVIEQVAQKQTDVNEEVKGPSKKIALDEAGAWSKAALGFARSQQVEPSDLYFKEVGGVEYIYANKTSIGVETAQLLPTGLPQLITSMSFPKNMRWGSYDLKFVRPIRWLVALFGSEVIPFTITDVPTGKQSFGHRFLGEKAVVEQPSQYVETLRQQSVIVDMDERKQMIIDQLELLMKQNNWSITIVDDLLEEVLFLVEMPSALHGSFDPSFLSIPQDVLITSMREHQRYFPVFDLQGALLPNFVTVRNGDQRSIDVVARGNEKVLRARLSDAKFFYEEDHKLTIDAALAKLQTIVYHEELGTIADKVERVAKIAVALADRLALDSSMKLLVNRAAHICKFDLVTQMVNEFPELQGIMGEDYANKLGEHSDVAKAVNEHYMPRFAGDTLPSQLVGAIVSIADKLDTVVGCFSIGIIPTGSQDPYALRRQTAGIVQVLIGFAMPIELHQLFQIALDVHEARGMKLTRKEVTDQLYSFFALRIKNWLLEHQMRYDVIDAVLETGVENLQQISNRAAAIQSKLVAVEKLHFKLVVEAFNRVNNLAAKATDGQVDVQLFAEEAERTLYAKWEQIHSVFVTLYEQGKMSEAIEQLASLQPEIANYFDHVMVMADEEQVRHNRLATLRLISNDIRSMADFSKLVW